MKRSEAVSAQCASSTTTAIGPDLGEAEEEPEQAVHRRLGRRPSGLRRWSCLVGRLRRSRRASPAAPLNSRARSVAPRSSTVAARAAGGPPRSRSRARSRTRGPSAPGTRERSPGSRSSPSNRVLPMPGGPSIEQAAPDPVRLARPSSASAMRAAPPSARSSSGEAERKACRASTTVISRSSRRLPGGTRDLSALNPSGGTTARLARAGGTLGMPSDRTRIPTPARTCAPMKTLPRRAAWSSPRAPSYSSEEARSPGASSPPRIPDAERRDPRLLQHHARGSRGRCA